MKKPTNLNEEIYRIKSLFNEERLYGNIIDNELINEITIPKGSAEKLIKKLFSKLYKKGIIKNLDNIEVFKSSDSIIDFLKKSNNSEGLKNIFKNLNKTEVDFLVKYFDDLNSEKIIKIFDNVRELGEPFYKVFPKEIRYDIVLDYINRLPDKPKYSIGINNIPSLKEMGKKQAIESLFGINPNAPMGEIPIKDLSDIPSELVGEFEKLKTEYIDLTNQPKGYLNDIKIGKNADEIIEDTMKKLSKELNNIFNKLLKENDGTIVLNKKFWDFLENNFKGISKYLEKKLGVPLKNIIISSKKIVVDEAKQFFKALNNIAKKSGEILPFSFKQFINYTGKTIVYVKDFIKWILKFIGDFLLNSISFGIPNVLSGIKNVWNFIKEFKEYTPLKIVDKFKDTKLKVYGPIIWKMTKSTSNITFDTFMGFYYPFISFLFWSNLKDQTIELLDKGFEKYWTEFELSDIDIGTSIGLLTGGVWSLMSGIGRKIVTMVKSIFSKSYLIQQAYNAIDAGRGVDKGTTEKELDSINEKLNKHLEDKKNDIENDIQNVQEEFCKNLNNQYYEKHRLGIELNDKGYKEYKSIIHRIFKKYIDEYYEENFIKKYGKYLENLNLDDLQGEISKLLEEELMETEVFKKMTKTYIEQMIKKCAYEAKKSNKKIIWKYR